MLNTTEELIGVVILFFLGSRKASASTSRGKSDPDADGADLVRRATQKTALDWLPLFENEGSGAEYGLALTRWAGIESSGNAHAVSTVGERGLFQLGAADQKEGALTDLEWSALLNPSTTNQQHAHMAMRQANWLWHRADPHIANPPDPVTDPISGIWYAYLEQQRPTDVRDGNLHGPALSMARELAQTWAGDAGKMHRLRAANVVAFGTPNP